MQDLEDTVGLNEQIESNILVNQNVRMITMGCGHNMADSNTILSKMIKNGAQVNNDDENDTATIVYVNSCTVKTPSAQKALNEVMDALSKGKKVIMGGCVPQAGESFMPKLTEYIKSGQLIVNGVLDDQKLDQTIKRLGGQDTQQQELTTQKSVNIKAGKPADESLIARKAIHNPSVLPVYRQNKFIDVVPISQGCMGSCTYCKTVQARGRLVSYPIEQVVQRIKAAAANPEIKEIWITGEDTLAWGLDHGTDFYPVMEQIVQNMGEHQMLRIGMADPESLIGCEEKLAQILNDKKVYKFLHLPLQSASDNVLQKMKRRYTFQQYAECIQKMLQFVPNLVIETDIIVGFPEETDEDFQKTIEYLETMKPEIVNITQYYTRPNTLAASMPQVDPQVKKQRSKIASEVSTKNYNREKYIGQVFDCIICEVLPYQNGKFKNNRIFGAKTPNYLSILLEFPEIQSGDKDQMLQETGLKPGDLVRVEVIACSRVALIGKIVASNQ